MIAMLDHVSIQCADMPDFWIGAQSTGGTVLHEPRVWPEYHEHYYGANASTRTGTTSRLSATCRDKGLASGVRGVRSG